MDRDTARDEIRRSIKCSEFLEKSKGEMFCCPHNDCRSGHGQHGTGAVKYYPATNTWYCHACHRGGDVIDVVRLQTGQDYNEALSFLAERIGIMIDPYKPAQETAQRDLRPAGNKHSINDDRNQQPEQLPRTDGIADYSAYYEQCRRRLSSAEAITYLQARGISPETAAAHGLGYDPAWISPTVIKNQQAKGNDWRPGATERIILPVNKNHYIARAIRPDIPKEYSKMNETGGGGVSIFNGAAIRDASGPVFVTEGAFDALSFLEAGLTAIALNSKGNGKLLLQQLQATPAQAAFIIVPDNDEKPETQKNTMQQAEALNADLQALGYNSIVYNVAGEYHDANDALRADRAAFERNAAAALDALRDANKDSLTEFLEKIQTEAYRPYKTELTFFDDLLGGGVIRQTLLLLLAAPGTGKTTLCAQIAEQMAAHKKPVIYFNLEMSREQMLAKAISNRLARKGTLLTATEVLQGYNWTEETRAAVIAAAEEYREQILPYLSYNPDGVGSDIDAIRDYLHKIGERAKAAGTDAPVVVLDYLHLISSRAGLDIQELIKQAVTALKQYAIDYNTFVVGIVATNRVSNTAGKITMESGRDSSNLEYTADYQLSLNYFEIDSGDVKPGDVEKIAELQERRWRRMILRVLKGRFCAPGKSAKVYYDAAHNIFYGERDWIPADAEKVAFDSPAETDAAAGKPPVKRF